MSKAMPANKPFRRTCRQFIDGKYMEGGRWMFVMHPRFAVEPEHYVRAFMNIQKDLHEIFEYVEPADINKDCYSYRIHALHMRVCIEIEANCKAILLENGYPRSGNWNMGDYKQLEQTHFLSAYEVKLPVWKGIQHTRRPFFAWSKASQLVWYQAYNAAKHDRHDRFSQANFKNLIDAVCGLVALLASQFHTWDFSPSAAGLATSLGGPPKDFETAIGGYFWVKFPMNFQESDRYNFDWQEIQSDADPFDELF